MDNKPKSYLDRGYSIYFEREFIDRLQAPNRKLPYLSSFDMDSYVEEVSATKLSGGIIQSKDGKLKINLEEGTIRYNDGITETVVI